MPFFIFYSLSLSLYLSLYIYIYIYIYILSAIITQVNYHPILYGLLCMANHFLMDYQPLLYGFSASLCILCGLEALQTLSLLIPNPMDYQPFSPTAYLSNLLLRITNFSAWITNPFHMDYQTFSLQLTSQACP